MTLNRGLPRPPLTLLKFFFPVVLILTGWTVEATSAEPLRIMPLGDSITAGYVDNYTWKNPFTFGYRAALFARLSHAGYSFQFVGTSPQPFDGQLGVPKTIVEPDLRTLKQDGHRGYGGTVFQHLVKGLPDSNGGIAAWMKSDNPDIVLLMMGINNIAYFGDTGNPADVEKELQSFVQTIVSIKPDVYVIVAKIAPYQTGQNTDSVGKYNKFIEDTLVPHFASLGKHVSSVDQYSNFLTKSGKVDASLYAGIAHPNPAGYERMAETWFQGIQTVVPPPERLRTQKQSNSK